MRLKFRKGETMRVVQENPETGKWDVLEADRAGAEWLAGFASEELAHEFAAFPKVVAAMNDAVKTLVSTLQIRWG